MSNSKKPAQKDHELIQSLTKDLAKVKRLVSPRRFMLRWLLMSIAVVVIEFVITGGMRPSFVYQVTHSSYYLMETLVAIALFFASSMVVLVYSVPDIRHKSYWLWVPAGIYVLFLVLVIFELKHPLFEESPGVMRSFPSLDHGMHFCEFEALAFALFPAYLMYLFLRSAAPAHPRLSAALLVFGSLGFVMVFMQAGCLYSPSHVLFHHLIPLGLLASISTLFGRKLFPH